MKGRRDFFALVIAQIFSISGTRLSVIAIPWLVLTVTGDPIMTGLVVFAEMAPYVLAKALAGPLIDRVGPRRISILGDVFGTVAVGAIPLLAMLDLLSIAVLFPLVVLVGVVQGPADGAKHALVPLVARRAGLPLERVTGVIGTIERLASMAGAGAAGALVALVGPAMALSFNAFTLGFAALILLVGVRKATLVQKKTSASAAKTSYGAELKEGFDFLRGDAVLVGIALMVAATNLLDQAYAAVLVPVWAQQSGRGAETLGLVFAVMSGFSVLGAMVATALGEKMPRLPVYVIAFMIIGFPRFAMFAFDAPLMGILITLAVGGFASGFLNPIISAVILERIPEQLVGRVSSLVTASAWALMPFGGIFGGALIAGLGLSAAFWVAGLCYLVMTLMPLVFKSFRGFSDREGEPRRV
ncbi:MFS transporter [Pelagibacterium sp.]|uniref:MFS transporter n=1 Tax=Pelagibacterium sp. TaxID=1967288 RepID=UPI003A8DC572